ncbi:odorant receptor 4-like [Prorops nasuta]|uniref:odorant receptor 4-like n=1 Tax=Prorops nasuta TaxID=863751 RepID=UPI0034CECA36
MIQALPLQIAAIVLADFDANVCFNILPVLFCCLTTILGSFYLYNNINLFQEIWSRLVSDWLTERNVEETKIKEKNARFVMRFINLIIAVMIVGIIMYVITFTFLSQILDFVIPLNETRLHIYPLAEVALLDTKDQKYFYLNIFQFHITMIVYILFGLTNFLNSFTISTQISGMFEVLNYRLENTIPCEKLSFDISRRKEMDALYEKSLRLSFRRHQSVIEFGNLARQYMIPLFTMSLTAILLTTILSLYQLTDSKLSKINPIVQLVISISFIFIICSIGQKIIDLSSLVGQKVYSGEWYYCSPRIQKMIILIMRRCDSPCKFDAYNIFVASLECFLTVMQASFSYCMAMKNF